ncbi:Krueppel-like factor 12b isoform X2 [Siphateles boraxobius]|uniref:Krueppel-like factor 12b isoform X2 n=1 Tax=Siphateles boraxobius TaxID=180520 RepID=UPI004063D468
MLMLDGMPAVRVKAEPLESERGSPKVHGYPDMEAVPILLSKVKAEPPEDLLSSEQFQTQTEPVDLSINKTRTSSPSSNTSPITSAFSPSSSSSSSSSPSVIASISAGMPSVLTPGPLVGSSHGVRGQQFLHIIHPVPPSSPSKLPSQVHRIPVVVQSLPLMYTTAVRSPSTLNSTIMLPLLDEAKCQGRAQTDPNGLSPRQIKSDSDDDDLPNVTLDSVNETGSTALSIARAVQEPSLGSAPTPTGDPGAGEKQEVGCVWWRQFTGGVVWLRPPGPAHANQQSRGHTALITLEGKASEDNVM